MDQQNTEKRKRGRPRKQQSNEIENKEQSEKQGKLFYNSVLKKVFLAGAVNRIALMDNDKSFQHMYYVVSKALKNEHIEVKEYKEKYGDRNRKHKYFVITEKGIDYLRENDDELWCKSLPDMTNSSIIVFPNDRRPSAIAFNVRCGNTILFAMQLHASISNYLFTGEPTGKTAKTGTSETEEKKNDVSEKWWERIEDVDYEDFSSEEKGYILDIEETMKAFGLDEEVLPETTDFMDEYYEDDDEQFMMYEFSGRQKRNIKSLPDIKAETFEKMRTMNAASWKENDGDIYFFPSKEIKKSLMSNEEVKFTDFAYGQYTGLLVGKESSMILYHAKHDGIGWSDRVEQKDIKTMRQFSVRCSPHDNISYGKIYGAILIYNEKNFADIINNKWTKRKAGTGIGKSFDAMHLVPISLYGTSLMSWIMTNAPEDRLAYEDNCALTNGLHKNEGAYYKIFRYMDDDGGAVINGMELDVKRLISAITVEKKNGPFKINVLCFRWQGPYYKALWPDVELVFAD